MNIFNTRYDLLQTLKKTSDQELAMSDFWIQKIGDTLPELFLSKGKPISFSFLGTYQVKEQLVNVYLKSR